MRLQIVQRTFPELSWRDVGSSFRARMMNCSENPARNWPDSAIIPPDPHEAPGVHCLRGGVLPWCRTRSMAQTSARRSTVTRSGRRGSGRESGDGKAGQVRGRESGRVGKAGRESGTGPLLEIWASEELARLSNIGPVPLPSPGLFAPRSFTALPQSPPGASSWVAEYKNGTAQ